MTANGIHLPGPFDQLGRYQLGAGVVQRLLGKDKSSIMGKERVHLMIVVIDPERQTGAQSVNKRLGNALEADAAGTRGKCDV